MMIFHGFSMDCPWILNGPWPIFHTFPAPDQWGAEAEIQLIRFDKWSEEVTRDWKRLRKASQAVRNDRDLVMACMDASEGEAIKFAGEDWGMGMGYVYIYTYVICIYIICIFLFGLELRGYSMSIYIYMVLYVRQNIQ